VNRIGTEIWCIQQLEEGWRRGVMNGAFFMMNGEYLCFSPHLHIHIFTNERDTNCITGSANSDSSTATQGEDVFGRFVISLMPWIYTLYESSGIFSDENILGLHT
jgi:hypothetical protein